MANNGNQATVLIAAGLVSALSATAATAQRHQPGVSVAARAIDRLVESHLTDQGMRPRPLADDRTFVRRVYLDIAGRIPTATELAEFASRASNDKRRQLIDELLQSPGHVSHMFHFWADLLRAKSRLAQRTSGEPYLHWIKEAVANNTPYDQMVRALLAANGPAHQRGNGATGYYLRDRGMPQDNMANTARVFLGTRLECAQCHNHPLDKWTQKQFLQMAAFTGGIRYSADDALSDQLPSQAMMRRILSREYGRNGPRALRRVLLPARSGISGSGTGWIRLPDDYRYDDAAPGQIVTAHTIFGNSPALDVTLPEAKSKQSRRRNYFRRRRGVDPEADSRTAYALWLTSTDNPSFTRVIANRMWEWVFGRAVIEPVDDLRDEAQSTQTDLLDHLEQLMLEVDYDLTAFTRVLYNTRTYHREAMPAPPEPGRDGFAGPQLRRMSAEQLWDSLLTLTTGNPDRSPIDLDARAEPVYERFDRFTGMTLDDVRAAVELELVRYTDPDRYRRQRAEERRRERTEGQQGRRETLRQIIALRKQMAEARRKNDRQRRDQIELQITRITASRRGKMVRAADLRSPAPPGHFLRQFGQSDREQINAASTEANVPQVLTLVNGVVDEHIARSRSALMRALARADSAADKIEAAFTAILARPPSDKEMATWRRDVQDYGDDGYRDLVWVLINSHEFRFIR